MKRLMCWLIGHDWKFIHAHFLLMKDIEDREDRLTLIEGHTKDVTYKCFRCDVETIISEN